MAAYHHVLDYPDTPGSLLIQHGSYQWVSREDQPSIPAGAVSLCRGIGQATRFRCLRFRPEELSPRTALSEAFGIKLNRLGAALVSNLA